MKASTVVMHFFSVIEGGPEVILECLLLAAETLVMKEMLVCRQVWNRNHQKPTRKGSKKRQKRMREEAG